MSGFRIWQAFEGYRPITGISRFLVVLSALDCVRLPPRDQARLGALTSLDGALTRRDEAKRPSSVVGRFLSFPLSLLHVVLCLFNNRVNALTFIIVPAKSTLCLVIRRL